MQWSGWLFSAKLAWARPIFRILSLCSMAGCVGMSFYFLAHVLPQRGRSGTLVMHYNIYLGIDQVHPWPWIMLLPAVWMALTLCDLLLAYGSFRQDATLAWSLNVLAFLFALPWSFALYYLSRMNI